MKHTSQSAAGAAVSGAVYLSIAAIAVKVLGLVYKIPLSHLLGDEGMGYFNAAYTVYGALYLLCTAGVPKAVSILTTECDVRAAAQDKNKIFRVCLWCFGLLGAALSAIFLLFARPIGHLIGTAPAAFCMMAIAPSLLFVSLGGICRGYLNGHARMGPIAISQLMEGICKLVLGLLFARYAVAHGFSLPLTAAFTILGIMVGSFVSFVYLYVCTTAHRSHAPKTEGNTSVGTRTILRRVLSVAAPITLSATVMSLTNMLDLTLIMKRLSYIGMTEREATVLYGNYTTLAVPMFNLCSTLVASVMTAMLPHMTRLFVQGDRHGFRSFFRRVAYMCAMLVLPFAGALMLFGEQVLSLLFTQESAALAAPMLTALAPAMIFMGLLTVVNTALEAAGHPRAALWSMLVGCAVKLPVSYVLLGQESYGILGAPIGTVISYGVALLVSLALLHRMRDVRISLLRCLGLPLLNTALSLSVTRLLYHALCMYFDVGIAFFACVSVGCVLYGVLTLCTQHRPASDILHQNSKRIWSFSTNR